MAEYPATTTIVEANAYKDFTLEEVGKHLSANALAINDIKILGDIPKATFKVVINSYNRAEIRVEQCQCKICKNISELDHARVLDIANLYFNDDTSIYVYTDKDGDPLYFAETTSTDVIVFDRLIYDGLDEINLDWLIKNSVEKDFNISNVAFLDQDGNIYYTRDTGFAKLFVPSMRDWFESNWPGIITDKEDDNALPITQAGLRVLLQMFISQNFGYVDTSKATLGLRDIFHVDVPELLASSLGTRLQIEDTQIKQLLHMLPEDGYEGIIEPKGFVKDDVITDYESLSEYFDEHKEVGWDVFYKGMEYFGMGCTIFLAPKQVILDKDSNIIFSATEINEIKYRGKEFPVEAKRETIELAITGDEIDDDFRKRVSKYFETTLGLKISTIRTDKKRVEYFDFNNEQPEEA